MRALPSGPVGRVLAALRAHGMTAKPIGTGWQCRCPAHDDRTPSLSVSAGDDGRALVHCHAGCAAESVVAAVGLSLRDLMPAPDPRGAAPRRRSERRPAEPAPPTLGRAAAKSPDALVAELERRQGAACARWTYHSADGAPVGMVLRWDTATRDGKPAKVVLPVSLVDGAWRNKAMPAPRPLYRLPDILALPPGAWVYVCEGEKAAEAARAISLVATTSTGGSKAAARTDWSPVRGKVVVVLPDNDGPGEAYAAEVAALCRAAGAEEVRVLRLREHWPDLPSSGDIADLLEIAGGDVDALHERIDGLAVATVPEPGEEEPDEDGDPTPDRYQPFPVEVLPEPARSFVAEGAAAIGCDPSFVALPLLSALAGAVGNTRRIRLKGTWIQPAILWTAVVGESGTQKTPAFRLALAAVRARQHRLMREHERAMAEWETARAVHEAALAAWKRDAARGKADREPPAAPRRPACARGWIDDCTVEALATLLLENPRGLLMLRDELSGWFSFGRYKNGGGGDDVARWLEVFDAGTLVVDRKTTGTVYVPSAAVSIAGGVQPLVLERSIGRQHRENGLLARLLLAYPPRRPTRWTEAELDPRIECELAAVFDRLYALEPDPGPDGDPAPRVLPLGPAAKAIFAAFVDEHGKETFALVGDEAAAWSKLGGYAARLALVLHLVRAAAGDPSLADPDVVDEASVEAGIALSRWFAAEARRVYAEFSTGAEDREILRLADLASRQGGPVSQREWQRIRSHRTADAAREELDRLAAAGHGRWEMAPPGPRGGRPSRRFVPARPCRPSDETPDRGQQGDPGAALAPP